MPATGFPRSIATTEVFQRYRPERPAIDTAWQVLAIYQATPPTGQPWFVVGSAVADVDPGVTAELRLRSSSGNTTSPAVEVTGYDDEVVVGYQEIDNTDQLIYIEGRRTAGLGGIRLLDLGVSLMSAPPFNTGTLPAPEVDQTGLVLWIDAAQDNTAANLADDQTYAAQLGSTAGADAEDPTVAVAGGRAVWSPDGLADYIETDYQASITPSAGALTVIFIGVYDATDATENYSRWFSTESANSNGFSINSGDPGDTEVSVALGGATTVVGVTNTSPGFVDGQPFMCAGIVDAGDLRVYVPGDGLSSPVDASGVGTVTHESVSRVFHPATDGLADREAASDCHALLIYERALSLAELDTIADIYGLAAAGGGGGGGEGGAGGAEASFNNGAPGDYDVFFIPDREAWFWDYDRDYFEPQHNPADSGPLRTVYVSAGGGGNGLSSGSPTTLANYMAGSGITPTAGDQVRIQGAGPHNIGSGTARSLNGTAANPIRFVRDNPSIVPVIQNSASSSSTWPFTNSSYLGFHGLHIDGNYPTYNNVWGLSFGQRFSSDSGMIRCHHIDVWHCELEGMAQNTFTFEGTNGNSTNADHRARQIHLFACDIHHSGQDPAKNFSELTYFGSGSETNDFAHDICIEACDLHDGPSGEAIDLKQQNTDSYIIGNLIHNVRVESQGGIAAFFAADLYYHYNAMWDIDRKSGAQDGCGIWTSSIDADYNLMWNIGITAFVSSRLQRGTMGVVVRHLTAWDMQQTADLGSGDLHHQNTGTFDEGNLPTIDFDATCISDDGDQGSTNAAASDFVGPTTGDAEATAGQPGSGFLLDAASAIAATAGALGKE